MSDNTLLEMRQINKSFNGSKVLNDVCLDIERGEVHALMGENGAGKSTLIKILTGVYPKDGGDIYIDGKLCSINSRTEAAEHGIGVVYQELSIIPTLSVYNNVLLGNEESSLGILKAKKMKQKVRDLITQYGFNLDVDAIAETLSIAQRQTIEILKSLCREVKIIVMDEPTASLSQKESEALFRIIEQLKKKGVSILYISHRLEEVFMLADRLTVLRDGNKVGVIPREKIDPAEVIHLMIGKNVEEASASKKLCVSEKEPVLDVKNLTNPGVFQDISFTLHKTEILGIGGLVGSGRTEVLRSIFGADKYSSGTVSFEGEPLKCSIKETIKKGFGLIPEDRRNQGFVPLLPIFKNTAIPSYPDINKLGFVKTSKENQMGVDAVKSLDIRPANPFHHTGNLSGGNQQKVVVGKWLARDLKVLLVDEPTAGVDIGAKNEIYNLMERLASEGVSIIIVTSDIQELLRISDRILIFRKGKVFREFNNGRVTQEDILMASSGLSNNVEQGSDV